MLTSTSMRWLVVAVSAAMLLAVAAACSSETIEVPGETVVVEKEVIKTVEVPGETVVKEVVKEVQVPGETIVVKEEVVKEVMVPGETVVVEKVVTETVEVPGETVTVEVVKEVQVPGETVVVEKVVTETVEVPGETVVVEKVVTQTVEVPGETVVVEKEVVKTVEVPGQTVVVEKEVIKTVEVVKSVPVEVIKEIEVPGKKYVTDPTTGKVVSAPEYGGTLTFAAQQLPENADTWYGPNAFAFVTGVNEKLAIPDWATPRDVFGFRTTYIPPSIVKGFLAESWTVLDDTTYVVKIRKGVNWHDKAPMNGRELTAKDIEYNYHRYFGLGSGYTEISPFPYYGTFPSLVSVTATDDWTVEFKLERGPDPDALMIFLMGGGLNMYPPEVIEAEGDIQDWRNMVGTGPFEVTDYVEGSSLTFTKNPNYWGYDEKYPENRLPYVDELVQVLIPEGATRLAALRAAEIDYLGSVGGASINSMDQLLAIKKTNPEFALYEWSNRSSTSVALNTQVGPTDDVNVRRALQMALDLETINILYNHGYGDMIPQPMMGKNLLGYVVPYEDWPAELQGYYTYDPAGAEALLDAAGYKRGADGIRFTLGWILAAEWVGLTPWFDPLIPYWNEIGVGIETVVWPTTAEAINDILNATYENMFLSSTQGADFGAHASVPQHHSDSGWNEAAVSDPVYDAIVDDFLAATTVEERQRLAREAMMYAAEEHWFIWGGRAPLFSAVQPWVIGYNGEVDLGNMMNEIMARLWIDSEMKEAMGH